MGVLRLLYLNLLLRPAVKVYGADEAYVDT
jgi:hypothetical protein